MKVLSSLEFVIKKVIKNGIPAKDINKAKFQGQASKIYDRETIEAYAFSLGNGFAQNEDINAE